MVDEEPLYDEDEELPPEEEGQERQPRDRRWWATVASIVIVIIIVILVLLMLRNCGGVESTANRRSSKNQIVPAEGHPPLEGSVSVWLAGGLTIERAIADAGVKNLGVVDMGGGRYVVKVTPGTEVDSVRRLRDVEGVYDAGRVYDGTTTE